MHYMDEMGLDSLKLTPEDVLVVVVTRNVAKYIGCLHTGKIVLNDVP